MPTLEDFRKRIRPELAIAFDQEGRAITIAHRLTPREIEERLETYLDENPADERTASWLAAWLQERPKAPKAPSVLSEQSPLSYPRVVLPEDALYATGRSPCHYARLVLVRSRDGGFVSKNCITCGVPYHARIDDLPRQTCGCGSAMIVRYLDGKNYFYLCESCGDYWMLASRIGSWYRYFGYYPLPAGPFN